MREKGAFMIWRAIFEKRLSLIGLIWAVLISLLLPHAANPKSDHPLDLIFLDTKGNEVRLSELAENKPLLLYFWATWCKPCRKTQPKVSALANKYRDRIKVVGINVGGLDSGRDIEKYSSRKKITYTMLLDREDQAVKTYSIYAIPAIILLDESGKILFRSNKVPKDLERFLPG
jgi:thiol-disulfide isomerase/thioredoxin